LYVNIEKCTNRLIGKLKMPLVKGRCTADRVLKWVLMYRKQNVLLYRNTFKHLKTIINKKINHSVVLPNDDKLDYPLLRFILGESRHSKYTEPFYCNTILPSTFNKTLEVNDEGKIMNLFQPININTPDVAWYCNDILCNINCKYSIPRVLKIIKYLLSSELNNFPDKIKNIDLCNSESRNIFKLGHTSACYVENYCSSILLFLTNLAHHFPSIQELVSCLYKIRRVQMKINQIDWAFHNININMLLEMEQLSKKPGKSFDLGSFNFANEDDIIATYSHSFNRFNKRVMDIPINICLSCHKLCYKNNVTNINNIRNPISNEHWEKLSEFVETNNLPSDFICLYCIKIFRSNALPPSCILNNLYSPVTPQVLLCLNDFERILIQRAKTFQVVVKMSSVAGRKQPKNVMNQKVIGRAFHLPLPLEETLKKLPIPNQAIIEHELYILVRSIPTKNKKIWQSLVNIQQVYNALLWIKGNNILYKDIFIPHYNNFENDILTMKTEYLLSDLTTDEDEILNTTDNDNNININAEGLHKNAQTRENENTGKQRDISEIQAMLTQADPSDEYYEQYTIHTLNEPRKNAKATDIYQMLKVDAQSIDQRDLQLDLKCFPVLFPFGNDGQYSNRL